MNNRIELFAAFETFLERIERKLKLRLLKLTFPKHQFLNMKLYCPTEDQSHSYHIQDSLLLKTFQLNQAMCFRLH